MGPIPPIEEMIRRQRLAEIDDEIEKRRKAHIASLSDEELAKLQKEVISGGGDKRARQGDK